jgi:hypothetical protein
VTAPSWAIIPEMYWVDSREYGRDASEPHPRSHYAVDPAPLASLVAAVIGLRDDLHECMKAIAEDDENGPIHLIHLLAACEFAARDVGGGLPSDGSIPGSLTTHGGFITATVSPHVLPSLVRALRKDGLAGATNLARKYSRRERFRALDVLVYFVAAPIIGLQISLNEAWVRTDRGTDDEAVESLEDPEESETIAPQGRRRRAWWGFSSPSRRPPRLLHGGHWRWRACSPFRIAVSAWAAANISKSPRRHGGLRLPTEASRGAGAMLPMRPVAVSVWRHSRIVR